MTVNKFSQFDSAKKIALSVNKRTRFSARLGGEMTKQRKEIPELAAVAGTSYEMARRYATGTGKPNRSRIEKIADWLGLDPDWLDYGDLDEASDSTPRRIGIPVYLTSDRIFSGQPSQYIDIGLRNETLAVKITNPLGIELEVGNMRLFKTGDICIIGDAGVGFGDYVLIENKEPDSLNKYMIRRVEFGPTMKPVFVANKNGYPSLDSDNFHIIGKVNSIVAQL